MTTTRYRLAIALLGKGSTNHLHRPEVVESFQKQGISVRFLVREDYSDLLIPLDGCHYSKVSFIQQKGWRARLKHFFEYIRQLYPSQDPGRKSYYGMRSKYSRSVGFRILDTLYHLLARYRVIVALVAYLEGILKLYDTVEGISSDTIDQLLLLGIGTASSELEGHLVWWAKDNGISLVNIIGNYDNLTSKGYRGVPVDRLLVWGPNMRDDATNFHGISETKVTEIGSIRYNTSFMKMREDRDTFLLSLGLDPDKKTILFAGFYYEFHYFEMIEVFKRLQQTRGDCQVILRIYPNKILMSSVYMTPLIEFARDMDGVYVSIGDPNYKSGAQNKSVLQIEEHELTHSLRYCDCVVNIFSTISLEACIFDKPAINMYYFPQEFPALARNPVYNEYEKFFHSRRLVSYGAVKTTRGREELIGEIEKALNNPDRFAKERQKTVDLECGVLDGEACTRLVEACKQEYYNTQ